MVTVDAMVGVAGMIAMVIELMIAAASRYFFSSCLIPKMSEIVQYNTMQYIFFISLKLYSIFNQFLLWSKLILYQQSAFWT